MRLWLALWLWAPACLWAAAQAAPQPGPEQLVRATTVRMFQALAAQQLTLKQEPTRVYALVDEIVAPQFDFETMGRWVLGKHWRSADPAQQQRFIAAFRQLLIRTYGAAMAQYEDEWVEYLPSRPLGEDKVMVRTLLHGTAAGPLPIDYLLTARSGLWKVFDVSIEGISLVTNYRTSFAEEIQRNGIEGLIARMVERNERSTD